MTRPLWRITDVSDDGDMVWMTMMYAPKPLLLPGTEHLKTFYPVRADDNRPRKEIIEEAVEWFRNRAVEALTVSPH